MKHQTPSLRICAATALVVLYTAPAGLAQDHEEEAGAHQEHHDMSDAARHIEISPEEVNALFKSDPPLTKTFDPAEQLDIYGNKRPVITQRPLLELGRELYVEGPLKPGGTFLGRENLTFPHVMVFGDWRTAAGLSDTGDTLGRLATRMNLDIDVGITATERFHTFIRPFDKNGNFTRIDFAGDTSGDSKLELDGNLDTFFFEGDGGAMFGGPGSRSYPVAVGKMPLLFQNGVWVEDAFTGVAFTLPAKNSPALDIANYDVTFFAAFDDVSTGALANPAEEDATVLGATAFIEANEGYWEVGYGFTAIGDDDQPDGLDYHNLTAAFSRRYGGWLSNSIRAIVNTGQDPEFGDKTADGALILLENSLISSNPTARVPYLNLFAGFGRPQSLARAADAGGVLKNTGINFEADAITGFPSLDPTGHDAIGAALGMEYLFGGPYGIGNQLVFEVAGLVTTGDDATALGDQVAFGTRFQMPLSHRFIFRADAIVSSREDQDDASGLRIEFRWKF